MSRGGIKRFGFALFLFVVSAFSKAIAVEYENAQRTPLLERSRQLYCAADSTAAAEAIRGFHRIEIPGLGVPNEWFGTSNPPALSAASLDIALMVLLRSRKRFPELNDNVEDIMTTWNFCHSMLAGEIYDLKVVKYQPVRRVAPSDSPINWSGFEQLGLLEGSDGRYIPELFERGSRPNLFFLRDWWILHKDHCLPHPETGEMYYQRKPHGPTRVPSDWYDKVDRYEYYWEPNCSVPYTNEEIRAEHLARVEAEAKNRAENARLLRQIEAQELEAQRQRDIEATERATLAENARLQREAAARVREQAQLEATRKLEELATARDLLSQEQAALNTLLREREQALAGLNTANAELERLLGEKANAEASRLALATERARREAELAKQWENDERIRQMRMVVASQLSRLAVLDEELEAAPQRQQWAVAEQLELARIITDQISDGYERSRKLAERLAAAEAERQKLIDEVLAARRESTEVNADRALLLGRRLEREAASNAHAAASSDTMASLSGFNAEGGATPVGSVPPFGGPASKEQRKYHLFSGSIVLGNRSLEFGEKDAWSLTTNFSYKPFRDSYWFARTGTTFSFGDDPIKYYWGIGYNDWHPGTWAFEINHWGPLSPGDGLDFENAVAALSYKFKSKWLEKYKLGGSAVLSKKINGDAALTLAGSWKPKGNWFFRSSITQGLNGGPMTWTYGFGYDDWRPFTFGAEYNNWGVNEIFDTNFRKNGNVTFSWKWQF